MLSRHFLLSICLLIATSTLAQRTVPYPIILVHGWTGSYTTWTEFTNYLENQAKLTIERNYLTYNLNCDNNRSTSILTSDVCSVLNTGSTLPIGNKDVFIVSFDSGDLSNQSAAVKQGYALKFAIAKVLAATGADKVVLLGHSMGGLAIREYLQNSSNWQSDGQHHVAKLVTVGTPHRGSNISGGILTNVFTAKDENSEAVRDLRESYLYSNCINPTGPCPGVYLWGGQETRTWLKTNALGGSDFYNVDVNCNGRVGDAIIGLNQKSISNDLDFACVIGGPTFSDGIVSIESQNLNTIYPNLAELFSWDCSKSTGLICHTQEPKQAFTEMMQALDEPKKNLTKVNLGISYKGFYTTQQNINTIDIDQFYFYVPQRGVMSISAVTSGIVTITNQTGTVLFNQSALNGSIQSFQVPDSGNYIVTFSGSSGSGLASYSFGFGFCPLPPVSQITVNGSTTFCESQSITLTSTAGYDQYVWLKDGVAITGNTNQLTVNQSGTFTVQGIKCGVTSSSTNSIAAVAKPVPAKPLITKDEQPNSITLSSSSADNNQWLLNGNAVSNATAQTYIPKELGNYTVRVTKDGCSSTSEIAVVKIDKPVLVLVGSNPICEGDSLRLTAPAGFGSYIFKDGQNVVTTPNNVLTVKKGGIYSVVTQRGTFLSVSSDIIAVTVNPKPAKPTITFVNNGFKSSSSTNNQWFVNGVIVKDSTAQTIRNVGSGSYTVRVTDKGCFSESDAFVITAIEPTIENLTIKIYPNPNEGTFWVELPQTLKTWTIDIFDVQGRQIVSKFHSNKYSNREQIEMQGVSGSFILKVSVGSITQSTKFIIE
jgi:pimeloyl-ACP methyl ester carboxylesterase